MAKVRIQSARIPQRAVKASELVTESYVVGEPWVDGGFNWWVEATVEDGDVTGMRLMQTETGSNKPVAFDASNLESYHNVLLKRLFENDGKV